MKVIVCGGRRLGTSPVIAASVFSALDGMMMSEGIDMVIHAQAPAGSAETLADQWAERRQIARHTVPAGDNLPLVNQQMLEGFKPDAVVAFPGESETSDMVRRAQLLGVKVIQPLGGPPFLRDQPHHNPNAARYQRRRAG